MVLKTIKIELKNGHYGYVYYKRDYKIGSNDDLDMIIKDGLINSFKTATVSFEPDQIYVINFSKYGDTVYVQTLRIVPQNPDIDPRIESVYLPNIEFHIYFCKCDSIYFMPSQIHLGIDKNSNSSLFDWGQNREPYWQDKLKQTVFL